jgi:dihydrofolate reductase
MTIELTDLELDEVSLVTAGDDPLATVAIFKSKTPKEENMTKEELDAFKAELQAEVDKFKAENEVLRKALIDNEFVITKEGVTKKVQEEEIEVGGVMVAKSAIPAPVLKELEKSRIEKEELEVMEKGKAAFPHFDPKVAKEIYRVFSANDEVMKAMKSADAVYKSKTEEKGAADTTDISGLDASAKLNTMAKLYQKDKGVTFEKAYAAVSKTDEGTALIKEIYKKD